jgi:cytidyltransferase-like protein
MKTNNKDIVRIMVDMSATLIHYGHIRLLKKAKSCIENKKVELVVGLTTDEQVFKHKGYTPELSYEERKETLEAISYVDEVVPTNWEITEETLAQYNIDFLVHGSDNSNKVKNIIQFPRTGGISSEDLRERALASIIQKRNSDKPMFTPGPSNMSLHNVLDLRSVFGRDDAEYDAIENTVLTNIRQLTGHDHIVRMQGSATTAIDVATSSFVTGKVLIIVSGYYSKRLVDIYQRKMNLFPGTKISVVAYGKIEDEMASSEIFDWIAAVYTETADGFLADIHLLNELARKKQAKLFLDATASINMEDHHNLADACAFSSCKGLGGLAGAGFITYNEGCLPEEISCQLPWALDINTYINKMTTGPYHAICSLFTISKNFNQVKENVKKSKEIFLKKYTGEIVRPPENQPNLCTLFRTEHFSVDKGIRYSPRAVQEGQAVVCHLGDMFTDPEMIGNIYENLSIKKKISVTK